MLKHFLCILTILAFFMTIPSGTRSDNNADQEKMRRVCRSKSA